MKKNERIAMKSNDLPEEIIDQIRKVEMDPKYNYLNDEMDSKDNDLNELLQSCTSENTRLNQKDKERLK